MSKYFFRVIVTLSIIVHSAQALTPEDQQFIETHKLPEPAEQFLDSTSSVTPGRSYDLGQYGAFIAKEGVDRIVGAQFLKDFIEKAGITGIKVADKYLYRRPGQPATISDKNYLVLAKKITPIENEESENPQPLSLKTIEELVAVIRLAHFTDLLGNIIKSGDELTLIDTENDSFNSSYEALALRSIPFLTTDDAKRYIESGAALAPRFEALRNYPCFQRRLFNANDQYELTPQLQAYVEQHAERPGNVYDAFLHAVMQNDHSVIQQFVDNGINLNQAGTYKGVNIYLLAAAIRMLNVSLANYLIEKGALVSKLNPADQLVLDKLKGQDVTLKDVLVNDEPIISYYTYGAEIFDALIPYLLRAGANSNHVKSAMSPLRRAVSIGNASLVQLLLSAGADVAITVRGNNLLYVAAEFQQPTVIPVLLKTNKFSREQISQALEKAHEVLPFSINLACSQEIITALEQALNPKE